MCEWKESTRWKWTVAIRAFTPVRVYGLDRIGVLINSGSTQGRGTTVYAVVAADDGKTNLALRTSWQNVTRADHQTVILKRLRDLKPYPNIIIPSQCVLPELRSKHSRSLVPGSANTRLKMVWSSRNLDRLSQKKSTTQGRKAYLEYDHIRAKASRRVFLEYPRFPEGCHRRIVYPSMIGIFHRDISKNNIVLSLLRKGLRALMDFVMATVGRPNLHLDCLPPPRSSAGEIVASLAQSLSRPPAHDKPYEAECIVSSCSYRTLFVVCNFTRVQRHWCSKRTAAYPLR